MQITCVQDVLGLIDQEIFQYTHQAGVAYRYNIPFNLWFRGESRVYTVPLQPSIFRGDGYHETSLCHSFCANTNHINDEDGILNLLTTMQHYGAPTRLLDWSENPLVALFFAVQEEDQDGRLYVLDSGALNSIACNSDNMHSPLIMTHPFALIRAAMSIHNLTSELLRGETFFKFSSRDRELVAAHIQHQELARYPIAFAPNRTNLRMVGQSSVFTVHGGKFFPYDVVPADDLIATPIPLIDINSRYSDRPFLSCHDIGREAKRHILEQLIAIGIHEGSIYNDLSGYAKYLSQKWRFQHN